MMSGETNLSLLLAEMNPIHNNGDYVFVSIEDTIEVDFSNIIGTFKEKEGTTLILEKNKADKLNLKYDYIASWITLSVHSSLDAVGLTAVISKALADAEISCNVLAAYYHDHIFVEKKDADKAMQLLNTLTKNSTL